MCLLPAGGGKGGLLPSRFTILSIWHSCEPEKSGGCNKHWWALCGRPYFCVFSVERLEYCDFRFGVDEFISFAMVISFARLSVNEEGLTNRVCPLPIFL